MANWKGKVVVVTGSSNGLGKEIAFAFANRNAKTILIARNQERLSELTKIASQSGLDMDWIVADVTDAASVQNAFDEVVKRHQRIDVLVNNVGKSTRVGFEECLVEDYKSLLEINFYSAVRCTLTALPHLKATSGQVVNIGSLASKTAWPNVAPYSVSKHALSAFSHQLRLEGPANVNCLDVCTGPIKRSDSEHRYAEQAKELPDSARQPGAGVNIKGIAPEKLAKNIVRCCEKRKKDLVIPAYTRILFAIAEFSPSLGDLILRRSTRKK